MTNLTIGRVFSENFDPLNIDLGEFKDLEVPIDTNLDLVMSSLYAAKYLRAADRCSEILSALIYHESNIKAQRNKTHARLFLEAKEHGYKTEAERKAYAESHDDFVKLEEELSKAYATRKFFELKHTSFIKSHHLMKDKLKREEGSESTAGFLGYGETDF